MARKSSRKKEGYAAWILTKMFDELTGNYFKNATVENQAKPLISESARLSEGSISFVKEPDRSSGAGVD